MSGISPELLDRAPRQRLPCAFLKSRGVGRSQLCAVASDVAAKQKAARQVTPPEGLASLRIQTIVGGTTYTFQSL